MADERTDRQLLLEALARLERIEHDHGGRLESIGRTLNVHGERLRAHGEQLERIEHDHGGRLESIGRTLNVHGERLRAHGEQLERIEHGHGKLLLELRTTQLGHDVTLRELRATQADHGETLTALDDRMTEVLDRTNDALPPDEPPAEATG